MSGWSRIAAGLLTLAVGGACSASRDVFAILQTEGTTPATDEEPGPVTGVAGPIRIVARESWTATAGENENQIVTDVRNALPGVNLVAPATFDWTCELPVHAGVEQTLMLHRTHLGVVPAGEGPLMEVGAPVAGQMYSATLDPTLYAPGWYEIRIRCEAVATTGADAGVRQFSTVAFQIRILGGTTTGCCHATMGNGSHTHAWHDQDGGYVYTGFRHLPDWVDATVTGTVPIVLTSRAEGELTLDHLRFSIDGAPQLDMTAPPEADQIYDVPTGSFAPGTHTFTVHAHGVSIGYQPGRWLAGELEITVAFAP